MLTSSLSLGIVPYLNVHPLVFSLRNVPGIRLVPQPPSVLADELYGGAYDAAIVPVFEYLRHADKYSLVPGISIACEGLVRSVVLFASGPLASLRKVHLDPASLTSVHLLKVLLAKLGLEIEYAEGEWQAGQRLAPETGALLIGDAALAEHGKHPFSFDLGELWRESTSLPFVFAAWTVAPRGAARPLNALLLQAKEDGLSRLAEVAEHSAAVPGSPDAAALYDYFTQAIRYDLGAREVEGLRTFGELCQKHGFLAEVPLLKFHSR